MRGGAAKKATILDLSPIERMLRSGVLVLLSWDRNGCEPRPFACSPHTIITSPLGQERTLTVTETSRKAAKPSRTVAEDKNAIEDNGTMGASMFQTNPFNLQKLLDDCQLGIIQLGSAAIVLINSCRCC
jgi:hypothetical protein